MDTLNERYEKLVIEDDVFSKRIETSELCLTAIIHYMFRYGDLIDKATVKSILTSVFQIEIQLREEILNLRLEKSLVACELKKSDQVM